MKRAFKLFLSISIASISASCFAVAVATTQKAKAANAATETSADWNLPYSATSADYGTYYNGITGTQKMTLKDQLTDLIKGHTVVSYDGLYDLYETSDNRPEDNTVFDMYGDFHFSHSKTCGNYGKEGDCFNREHSVPKSWFNNKTPMYSDAFHLYPTDGKVNGMRSNYAFGEVSSASYSYTFKNNISGVSKKGTSKRSLYSGTVFEPADCYKGDFARTYFYFATRYKDIMGSMTGDGQVHFTSATTYCNLTQYSKELFLDWHRADPVSKKEVVRNNAVYARQHNRNPFIDHPEYVEAIWGDTPIGTGSVSLSQSQLSLTYGGSTAQLTASASDNSQITWTTSNDSVASLSSTHSNSGVAITVTPGVVGNATITATATIKGNNYSATCYVVVTKTVSALSYTGEPNKTEYIDGDTFDPTGLTVTATYTDNSQENVTDLVTWTPNPLVEGTTTVTGTYSGQKIYVNGITVAHNDHPVSVNYEIDMTKNTQMTSSTTSQVVFNQDIITITIDKHNGSTNANNYCPPSQTQTRAYQNQKLTISAGGASLGSVVIHCLSNSDAAGLANGNWTNATNVARDENGDVTFNITTPTNDVSCVLSGTVKMSGISITIGDGDPVVLTSISTTGQTTIYQAGNVFSYDGVCTAHYSDESSKVVTPVVDASDVDMSIPGSYTVNLEYTEGGITVSDCYDITVEEVEDTGTFVNSIAEIYEITTAGGTITDIYGLYVGSVNSGESAIIMNGEYGIMLYKQSASGWVENQTYIHVTTSKLVIFNSLYELKECSCETITNVSLINEKVAPVVTYAITGQESTSDLTIANRLSLMNGVVTKIEYKNNSNYYDGWDATKDNRVTMTVNGHSIQVFIKKNDSSTTLRDKFQTSLNNTAEVTVQGFSSFYNAFQVQFKAIIDPVNSYTAEDFAQDFLNHTNGACTNSFNNNWHSVYSTLAPIWVTLEGADYFAKLPAAQKAILKNTVANENGDTLEEALARYDHICLRYSSLTNFLQRESANSASRNMINNATNNTLLVVTIVTSAIAITATLSYFILKKKKQY